MTKFKTSRRARIFLNWIIRRFNRHLPISERIHAIPLIPFSTSTELEAITLAYYNLIMDGYADWRDDNRVRADEIASKMAELRKKHGIKLRKYLAPYKNLEPKNATYAEHHRSHVAYDLFHFHGAAENEQS